MHHMTGNRVTHGTNHDFMVFIRNMRFCSARFNELKEGACDT